MGIFFVGLGGVLAAQALLARRSSQKKYVNTVSGFSIKTLSAAIVLSVVYALLFRSVGFPIMTFAVVAGFSFLLGARNFVIPIILGLVVSAILYAAFRYLLGVVVPAGVLSGIV